MRLTLRTKVTLTISLFLVVIFGLIMYLTLTRNVSQSHRNLNEQSKSFASLATPPIGNTFVLYQDSGSIRIDQQVQKFLALDPDVTAIGIVSVDGKQLYKSPGSPDLSVSESLASSFKAQSVKNNSGYIKEVVQPFFEDSGSHRYSIVYKISTKRIEQSVNDAVRVILYVGVAILVVSIVLTSWALNILFIKPLREVSQSADRISSGDYSQQVVTRASSQDEIGKLAHAVNSMAEALKSDITKLQDLDKLKTEFMMIASHNLRTPLTIIRGAVDTAEFVDTKEGFQKIIASIQDGVTRLRLLAEDMLTISSLEAGGQEALQKTPVEAKSFLGSTVSEFEPLAKNKGIAWKFSDELPDGSKLEISQANMRSALGNLIDNAIKFTKEGGSVNVSAVVSGNSLVFKVEDTGIGINQEEMAKLFTKFHRGTDTERYDYEGMGLGLYLTKLLVEQHGGQIKAESQAGKGSSFTVTLPLVTGAPTSAPPAPGAHPPAAG